MSEVDRGGLPLPADENEHGFASRRIDRVRVVNLIEVVTTEGNGVDECVRLVARFYTANGVLVAVGAPTAA